MTTIIKRSTPGGIRSNYYPVFRGFHSEKEAEYRNSFAPLNIIQNDDVYKIELNVAGWQKEDVDIKIEDDTLIISGDKKVESEEKKEYHLREFSSQRFFRSVILNEEIDQESITAELKDGILSIELKKFPEEELHKSKKIEIR